MTEKTKTIDDVIEEIAYKIKCELLDDLDRRYHKRPNDGADMILTVLCRKFARQEYRLRSLELRFDQHHTY